MFESLDWETIIKVAAALGGGMLVFMGGKEGISRFWSWMRKKIDASDEKLRELEKLRDIEISELKALVKHQNEQILDLTKELSKMTTHVDVLTKEIELLRSALEQSRTDYKELKQDYIKMRDKLLNEVK